MKFSSVVERIAGEGAEAWTIHYKAREAQDRGEDVIVLYIGDPDLPTPAPVLERAIEALRAGDLRYTPAAGRHAVRAAIARRIRARTGQPVSADNVIFLSGTQNALFAASMCIAGPGDEVLAMEPLYPSYPATIQASGARLVRVPAPASSGFRPDLELLEAAITPRTRALFFATPNNPSGVILSEQELTAIGELARRHSLWLVADEVYAGLAPGGRVPGLATAIARAGDHRQQHIEVAFHAGPPGRLAGGTDAAGQARGISRDVHAVRSAGLHPGGHDDGARGCGSGGIENSRFVQRSARYAARGTQGLARHTLLRSGRRHVHVDGCARHGSFGLRFHVRAIQLRATFR